MQWVNPDTVGQKDVCNSLQKAQFPWKQNMLNEKYNEMYEPAVVTWLFLNTAEDCRAVCIMECFFFPA